MAIELRRVLACLDARSFELTSFVGSCQAGRVCRTPVIRVRVTGVSALRNIIGRDRIIILNNGSTVGKLLDELEGNFGPVYKEMVGEGLTDSLKKRFSMLLNGVFMSPEQNLERTLNDHDEIVFFQLAGA